MRLTDKINVRDLKIMGFTGAPMMIPDNYSDSEAQLLDANGSRVDNPLWAHSIRFTGDDGARTLLLPGHGDRFMEEAVLDDQRITYHYDYDSLDLVEVRIHHPPGDDDGDVNPSPLHIDTHI